MLNSMDHALRTRAQAFAQSKALQGKLRDLDPEHRDVKLDARSAMEYGAAMMEMSDDLDRRVVAILKNSN
jgi:phage shock protein A